MHEVLSEAFAFVNLPFTVLLGLVAVYWVLVVLGALDTSFGSDLELGGHVEGGSPELGGHHFEGHETEAHGDVGHDGFLSGVAHFINLGDVPLMVVVSVLSLSLWTGSLIANRYFTGHDVLMSLAFLVPNFIVGLIVTRYGTLPFKPLFRLLRRDE